MIPDQAKREQAERRIQSPREQINFQSSLPADVLWGSFVTHSKDVRGEATFRANKPKQPVRKKQNADNKDFELIITIKRVGYENKWNDH